MTQAPKYPMEKGSRATGAKEAKPSRHYTVHWETKHVFGFRPVQAVNAHEARRKHKAEHPEDVITKVHRGPVVTRFVIA